MRTSNQACSREELMSCDVYCCLGVGVGHSEDLWDVARFEG